MIEKSYAQNQNCTGLHSPFHIQLSSQANGKWLSSLNVMPTTKLMLCKNINLKSSQTPLPILKFGKEAAASRASTADTDSFLSNPKKEQFWNASRLLAIRRFKPLRLSLRIKSSLWYLEDGISKSRGPRESGCNMETIESSQLSTKDYRRCIMAVYISMVNKLMPVVLTEYWNGIHWNTLVLPKWPCFSGVITELAFRIWTSKLQGGFLGLKITEKVL